ncbi:MAG: carbamate kinase [candidate division WOR-3 bacterium]|nr:carbamate kinase [candidate division WOR-3 bacterium]
MRIVIAIGGNSLLRNGNKPPSFFDQFETVQETCANIAEIVCHHNQVVITHGNGPQVGTALIRSYLTRNHLPEIPLEIATALTQAEIGYMIQLSLKNELAKHKDMIQPNLKNESTKCKCPFNIVTVITQVLVDKDDPGFSNYTKPVGPFYSQKEAFALQAERNWIMKEDAGRGFRRMVASPKPKSIVEINIIKSLIEDNHIVIAAGGGGIPVIQENNHLKPIPAVIDKDLTSALLADLIDANCLIISTSIDKVYLNFNTNNQIPLNTINLKQAIEYLNQGHFAEGSMKPKIQALIKFIEKDRSRFGIITNPSNIATALTNNTIGTRIVYE